MISFRSAGDIGDIIASLPAVRALGGGVFYLEAASYTRVMLTPDNWRGIDRVLRDQPYIQEVKEWPHGTHVTHNLNDFRAKLFKAIRAGMHKDRSLVDWQLINYGIPLSAKDEAWITISEPAKVAQVIFNRTGAGRPAHQVYQNQLFPWAAIVEKYGKDAAFVGTDIEYRSFCAQHGTVPRVSTADIYDVARVIAGCDLFVGNQSVAYWLAEGMKKNLILEVWLAGPNSLSIRDGAVMGWDENINLPDLPNP